MRIGVLGGGPQKWPSLNLTLATYLSALREQSEVAEISDVDSALDCDLLVNFAGDLGWRIASLDGRPPILFVLHGGAVLDRSFLAAHLGLLGPRDGLIGNCSADAEIVETLLSPAPRVHVIALPTTKVRRSPAIRQAARASLGYGDEGVILIVSRLVPQKNVHNALRMIARAVELGSSVDWRIVIVGSFWRDYPVLMPAEGSYHEWLPREVDRLGLFARTTLFASSLSDDQLSQVYNAADLAVSVTHSIDENYGYFAVEAMAHGVPVLGTAYGGQKDTVVAGETGWRLPTWSTPGGIRSSYGVGVDLLRRLSLDQVGGMGSSAAKAAMSRYSYEQFAKKLDAICREAVIAGAVPSTSGSVPASLPPDYEPPLGSRRIAMRFKGDSLDRYRRSIEHYVSDDPPRVKIRDRLRTFAPMTESGGIYTAADPTWPLSYEPSSSDAILLDEAASATGLEADDSNLAPLQRLVDDGILVPEAPSW